MCVADYVAARCWSEGVQVREKRGNKGKCVCVRFIHICSVPDTGGAQRWPIVGRNDNRLYLTLQTA